MDAADVKHHAVIEEDPDIIITGEVKGLIAVHFGLDWHGHVCGEGEVMSEFATTLDIAIILTDAVAIEGDVVKWEDLVATVSIGVAGTYAGEGDFAVVALADAIDFVEPTIEVVGVLDWLGAGHPLAGFVETSG